MTAQTEHDPPLDETSAYLCDRITKEQAEQATTVAQTLALQIHKTLSPLIARRIITGTQSLACIWFTAQALMFAVTTAIETAEAIDAKKGGDHG